MCSGNSFAEWTVDRFQQRLVENNVSGTGDDTLGPPNTYDELSVRLLDTHLNLLY